MSWQQLRHTWSGSSTAAAQKISFPQLPPSQLLSRHNDSSLADSLAQYLTQIPRKTTRKKTDKISLLSLTYLLGGYESSDLSKRMPRSIGDKKTVRRDSLKKKQKETVKKKSEGTIQNGGAWIKDLRERMGPKPRRKSASKSGATSAPKPGRSSTSTTPQPGRQVVKWEPWKPPDEKPGRKQQANQQKKKLESKKPLVESWLASWLFPTSTPHPDKKMETTKGIGMNGPSTPVPHKILILLFKK